MSRFIIIIFFICFESYSLDFIIDTFGKEKVKIYEIDKSNSFRIVTTNSVFKTNTNIYGNSECSGTTEKYLKEVIFNIICEVRDGKYRAYFLIKNNDTTRGSDTEITSKVIFVGGTGPWARLIGKKCFFAYIEFGEGASHSKIKCSLNKVEYSAFKR